MIALRPEPIERGLNERVTECAGMKSSEVERVLNLTGGVDMRSQPIRPETEKADRMRNAEVCIGESLGGDKEQASLPDDTCKAPGTKVAVMIQVRRKALNEDQVADGRIRHVAGWLYRLDHVTKRARYAPAPRVTGELTRRVEINIARQCVVHDRRSRLYCDGVTLAIR